MDNIRLFIKQVLEEGKLERETTQISRVIISVLREIAKVDGFHSGLTFFLGPNELPKIPGVNGVVVTLDFVQNKGTKPSVGGIYDPDNKGKELGIDIYATQAWEDSGEAAMKDFSALLPDLKDAIRHELEHSGQELGTNSVEKTEVVDQLLDYYTDQGEIEAFTAGLYKKAKMTKAPLSQVIDDKLDGVHQLAIKRGSSKRAADRLIKQIRQAWVGYIRQRFPKGQLKGRKYKTLP